MLRVQSRVVFQSWMDSLCVSTGVKRPREWEENTDDNSQTPSNLVWTFCAVIRITKQDCAVFNASTSYCRSTTPTWVWKRLCGRPAAVRSADTTDHFQKLVSGSPLTGNLNAQSGYCISFCNWYLILKAWAIKKKNPPLLEKVVI